MRTVDLVADRGSERLDAFVARRLPELSRSHAHRLISDGLVTVDGRQMKPAERVAAGATVSVTIPPPEPAAAQSGTEGPPWATTDPRTVTELVASIQMVPPPLPLR